MEIPRGSSNALAVLESSALHPMALRYATLLPATYHFGERREVNILRPESVLGFRAQTHARCLPCWRQGS